MEKKKKETTNLLSDQVCKHPFRKNKNDFVTISNNIEPQTQNIVSEIVVVESPIVSTTINTNVQLNIPQFQETKELSSIHLHDKLLSWVVHHKPSHNCVNGILKIMKTEGLDVPTDVRTLMKTPHTQKIIDMCGGSYINFGIKKMLSPILKKHIYKINSEDIIKLGINIDGLPLSKSSKSQLWPILISIVDSDIFTKYVLLIGVFHGMTKPSSINEYFNPFLVDLSILLDSGLIVDNIKFQFKISHIVCDSPAKAFLLNVKAIMLILDVHPVPKRAYTYKIV